MPTPYDDQHRAARTGPTAAPAFGQRIGRRLWHEVREALPPTIFFFVGFNFVVLTSNLLVARYLIGLSNFMLTTLGALVVGKAVLVANKIPLLRRYDRAALIRPILFKTAFYWIVVFFARLFERFVHFSIIEPSWSRDPVSAQRNDNIASASAIIPRKRRQTRKVKTKIETAVLHVLQQCPSQQRAMQILSGIASPTSP